MALATSLLRRSSGGCVIGRGTRLSVASMQSHIILPTSLSSGRQMSSVAPSSRYNDTDVRDLISKVQSMKEEVAKLRNDNEKFFWITKEKVKVEKEEDPSLKQVESEMSKVIHAKKIPDAFEILWEPYWGSSVFLTGLTRIQNEKIDINLLKPNSSGMRLVILIGSCTEILSSKVGFCCIVTADGYRITHVNVDVGGFFSKGVAFDLLPKKVQSEFYRYLELWGVDSSATKSMYEYMLQKVKWKHLRGFHQRLKKMVHSA